MTSKFLVFFIVVGLLFAVSMAQWGGYDPLVGGPNRQWRRYYRCLETGICPYDYNTGHYFGRRELNRMYSGGWK